MAMDPIEARRIQREKYHEADVVVVGAGVFGCAAAYALAQQGRSVILLERWMTEPDRIVGELLQPGGVRALKKLGLGHCLDDIDSIPCHGYHVLYRDGSDEDDIATVTAAATTDTTSTDSKHGHGIFIPYPVMDDDGGVPHQWSGAGREGKRETGRGFHHGRFITRLRAACLAHPNVTVRETEAVRTVRGEHAPQVVLGVETRTTDRATGAKTHDCFFGQLTIVADGYSSRFRKEVTDTEPVARSKFYALELHDADLPAPGYGHVVIGGTRTRTRTRTDTDATTTTPATTTYPILLYQIGTHETRALFDVPHDIPEARPSAGGVRNYLAHHAIPSLPASVRPSAVAALERGRLRSMPNSWLPPTWQTPRGLVVLGDAANMRHPLTGAGMTVALSDAVLLADLLRPDRVPSLGDEAAVCAAVHSLYRRRRSYTAILNVLAQALYALFAAAPPGGSRRADGDGKAGDDEGRGGAGDAQLEALRRGCVEYFRRGVTDGPCGLLAGLLHRPVVLAYHFFAVAFLAIWLNGRAVVAASRGGPLVGLAMALLDAVLILAKACVVFLPLIWREGFW